MMDLNRTIELLQIEKECVMRASGKSTKPCNRDCANCELVQKDEDLIQMYSNVINLISALKGAL